MQINQLTKEQAAYQVLVRQNTIRQAEQEIQALLGRISQCEQEEDKEPPEPKKK